MKITGLLTYVEEVGPTWKFGLAATEAHDFKWLKLAEEITEVLDFGFADVWMTPLGGKTEAAKLRAARTEDARVEMKTRTMGAGGVHSV